MRTACFIFLQYDTYIIKLVQNALTEVNLIMVILVKLI